MKYINDYLEEEVKIKPLGKVTFNESCLGEEVGYEIVIDGVKTGIEIYWNEYATWLEKKLELIEFKNVYDKPGDFVYKGDL